MLSFNDHSSGVHPHNLMLRSTGTYFIMSYINGYCMPLSFKVEILLYILKDPEVSYCIIVEINKYS